MAVHIIGSSPETPDAESKVELPQPEGTLPGPETAEAAQKPLSDATVLGLLDHEHPLLRGFGVEQCAGRDAPEITTALLARLADEDRYVFSEALAMVAERRVDGAKERVAELFKEASEERAAALGTALGRLAPDDIVSAVQNRSRIDDVAFPSVTTALAVAGGQDVSAFFKKALGRARMLNPDRRRALFSAALISGDVGLCRRVLGDAIGDSNVEAHEGAYPSRVAVASLGGLPASESRIERGEVLYDRAREVLESDAAPALGEAGGKALKDALAQRKVADALRALAPLTEWSFSPEVLDEDEMGTLPLRRQGLLTALVDRARDFEHLELGATTIFLAAAAQAASLIIAGGGEEVSSEAMTALSKSLGVDAHVLAEEDLAALSARFESQTPRDMRRVHTILTRQAFRRASTLARFIEAVTRAGHGAGLISAAAEAGGDSALVGLVHAGMSAAVEDAETAVLEVLDDDEAEPHAMLMALALGERLRTERVALSVGQRFFDLRKLDKAQVSRSLLYAADARVLPILESRAFPDEPEEAAWALLSVVHGAPIEGRVQEALERLAQSRTTPRAPLEVELECDHCGEVGVYGFKMAYVDPEAKDEWGDPAFVGQVQCKACGAEDKLRPTKHGGQALAGHMLEFLEAVQRGEGGVPLVTPSVTTIGGEKVGLAEALRRLDARVAESPSGIRLRLERARLRNVLEREGFEDDLAAIRAEDADAVEASVLEAAALAKAGHPIASVTHLVDAHRALGSETPPRVYDSESPEALQRSVEDLLLEMSDQGAPVPKDIDLTAARARRKARDAARAREQAEAQARLAASRAQGASGPQRG